MNFITKINKLTILKAISALFLLALFLYMFTQLRYYKKYYDDNQNLSNNTSQHLDSSNKHSDTNNTEHNTAQIDNTPDALQFLDAVSDIHSNLEQRIGKSVELIGYVSKDINFPANRFVLARSYWHKEESEPKPSGIIAEYNGANELKDNEWIKITAIVDKTPLPDVIDSDEYIPLVKINKIEKIEARDPIVYVD